MSQTPDSAVPATPSIPADAEYSFRDVEARWAGYWEQAGTFAPVSYTHLTLPTTPYV